ncbi:unnamed protein product [Vicia faba]|uniref:Uncharacterized protein n=1 Tax=Vicia faba TaxID=3906 RepID=A0AAV0YZE2_VICFA|nr:unnamed protein product [Vicia faba]
MTFWPPTMKTSHTVMRTLWSGFLTSLEINGRDFLRTQRTCSIVRWYERKGHLPTGCFKFPTVIGEYARRIRENVSICMNLRLKRRGCACPLMISMRGISMTSIGALSTSPERAGVYAGVRACMLVYADKGHAAPHFLYLSSPKTIIRRGAGVCVVRAVREAL